MINIAIIGAGQLGSRHLQALANLKTEINIQVVDPSMEAIKTAETRFKEVGKDFNGKLSFHSSISEIEKDIKVSIIATNSKIRRKVIEELSSHSQVEFLILEKFLFPKEEDYFVVKKLLEDKKIKTWVNCPRRLIPFYKQLRKELSGNIHFSVTGNLWGMGCNGIHMLDLFAFLTKSPKIELSNNLIDPLVHESKRAGYVEFTGTISGFSNQHSFRITSFDGNPAPSLMNIHTSNVRYSIKEAPLSKVWRSSADKNWNWEELSFNMPFQSQLTHLIIEELIETGTCGLTPYDESSGLHQLFLNNLLTFVRKLKNDNSIDECLIT